MLWKRSFKNSDICETFTRNKYLKVLAEVTAEIITCHRRLVPVSTIRPLCTQRQRRSAHTLT